MADNDQIFDESINLKELYEIIKPYIVVIIMSTIIFGAAGYIYTAFFIRPLYEANATMIVNAKQNQETYITYDQLNSAKNLVDTYAIILTSDTVLEPIIDQLNLDISYPELRKLVRVNPVNNTQVMQITVNHYDSNMAKRIVEKIVEAAPGMIIQTVNAGSVEMVSLPRTSGIPVSPNRLKNAALASFFGFVLIAGIVMLREMLDNTFSSDADIIKHIGLPVLGVIPEI